MLVAALYVPGDLRENGLPAAQFVLVVNFLGFVGSGWHTTGDAILANTAAAMAREQRQAAREAFA
jgi:hypothetical protein